MATAQYHNNMTVKPILLHQCRHLVISVV